MTISANAVKVLNTVIFLTKEHGPYFALTDVKNGIAGQPYSHVAKAEIDALLKDGVTIDDVKEVMELHNAHTKFLQLYMASIMQATPSKTTKEVVIEIQDIINNAAPEAKASHEVILQSVAGVNELDTAFVFTQSRLDAVDALVAAHVAPEEAFNIINHLRGEFINRIPKIVESATKQIYALVCNIVIEQMISPEQVKSDINHMLTKEGKFAYDFKQEYATVILSIQRLIDTDIKGLNPVEFILAQFTPEFYQKIEIEAIVAKENTATDMVYNLINSHVILPAEYMPRTVAQADVDGLYNMKMFRISHNVFTPWLKNHTGYDFPKPICPPAAAVESHFNEGVMVGAVSVGALCMAAILAKPIYQNFIVPAAKTTMKAWSNMGLLLFSSIEKSQYSQAKKHKQEQSSTVTRISYGQV